MSDNSSTFGARLAASSDLRRATMVQRALLGFALVGAILLLLVLIGNDSLPWALLGPVAVVCLAVWALGSGPRLQMGVTAALVVLMLRWAGPAIIGVLPNSPLFDGEVARRLLLFVLAAVALAGCAACWWHWQKLLLGAPARGSFAIDTTILVAAYIVVAFSAIAAPNAGSVLSAEAVAGVFDSDLFALWFRTIGFAWLLPVGIWLAFTCRQGGVLAIGSTAGLVGAEAAFRLLPGGSLDAGLAAPLADFGVDSLTPVLAVIAVALLAVVIWWSLSPRVEPPADRLSPGAAAPINGLSIVAFIASWVPLTAVPGIVLGHMAYDQVAGSPAAQRGLGLARWSIVIGYLALGAGVFFYLNVIL